METRVREPLTVSGWMHVVVLYGQVCPVLALGGLDGAGERAALYLDFRRADTRARFRVPRAVPRDE